MASTELRKNGSSLKGVPDKQVRALMEYIASGYGSMTKACIAAGYSKSCAATMGMRILKRKEVVAFVGKFRREQSEKFEIQAHEVLRHLCSGATRSGKGFFNDRGILHSDIQDLPDDITDAIDGIKQKVRRYTREDGSEVTEVETELKLMSKASCLDMCMKHKGLFSSEKLDIDLKAETINWDKFTEVRARVPNPVQARIEAEEAKTLEVTHKKTKAKPKGKPGEA